jgi:hypothetical protein
VSAGRTIQISNIKWGRVKVSDEHGCLSSVSYMRSKDGFIFLRFFVDDCDLSLENLDVEIL